MYLFRRVIFVEVSLKREFVPENHADRLREALASLRGDAAGGTFDARRQAARSVARFTRRDFIEAGSTGSDVAAALRERWGEAVSALAKSPRDARIASELKVLAPALAVADPGVLRALVDAALGVGGLPDSTRDAMRKELDRALVIAGREEKTPPHAERSKGSFLQNQIALCSAVPVALYCRAGLEDLIIDALRANKLNARTAGRGLVLVNMGADAARLKPSPFAVIQGIRFWHDCGFVFSFPPSATQDDIGALIAGPMSRYLVPFGARVRFDWQASRAENWDLAARLQRLGSALVNAPREADWDLMIDQMAGRIVARPKSWFDLRFDYREREVPASSHAPLAAALAFCALRDFPAEGGAPVIWDPFCGAGTELIEAGLLRPTARLTGSDLDPRAIEAASHNARRAGVKADWIAGDFREIAGRLEAVDVILTNPPLGRRVAAGEALDLGDELIAIAARKLRRGKGCMVWVAPDPVRAAVAATKAGMRIKSVRRVDLGGFDGEIQVLVV